MKDPGGRAWQPADLLLHACQLAFQPLMSLELFLYPMQVLGHIVREA